MVLQSWGNYPKIESTVHRFNDHESLRCLLALKTEFIARGNGRSYGDSSLNDNLIHVRSYDCFLSFDREQGTINLQAGVLLAEVLEVIIPEGWFLPVTPGTKYITIGGAIASDIHGKNHHIANSFCHHINGLTIMLADGNVVQCSRTQNADVYRATCGGMGLTGIILTAELQLRRISSSVIDQKIVKTKNLRETLEAFDIYQDSTYSVAWIDCHAKNDALGKGLVILGEHAVDGQLEYRKPSRISLPVTLPSFTLNSVTVKLFNTLYYGLNGSDGGIKQVSIDKFFYPLDAIRHWNRMYGSAGFIQYQFVLPAESSLDGLRDILTRISISGQGSPLTVLKLLGEQNDNWLSFPMRGFTLALDFRVQKNLLDLLSGLDEIVVDYGGRFYLTKDARVPGEIFEVGYKRIEQFRALREQYGMNLKFNSLQSRRVGI